MDENSYVVIFCPVCCTSMDAQLSDVNFECPECETSFTVQLDPAKIASHSSV